MSDDAYITLRTVDNFINGYGLTWNISERVQAYTHPLWMFLLSIYIFFYSRSLLYNDNPFLGNLPRNGGSVYL